MNLSEAENRIVFLMLFLEDTNIRTFNYAKLLLENPQYLKNKIYKNGPYYISNKLDEIIIMVRLSNIDVYKNIFREFYEILAHLDGQRLPTNIPQPTDTKLNFNRILEFYEINNQINGKFYLELENNGHQKAGGFPNPEDGLRFIESLKVVCTTLGYIEQDISLPYFRPSRCYRLQDIYSICSKEYEKFIKLDENVFKKRISFFLKEDSNRYSLSTSL